MSKKQFFSHWSVFLARCPPFWKFWTCCFYCFHSSLMHSVICFSNLFAFFWNSNSLVTWYKELTHWKIPWCWEILKARGGGDDRGWDGWVSSQLDGNEFERAPGVGDGQGSLASCSPQGSKESDMTEWLHQTELKWNVSSVKARIFISMLYF